MNYRNRKESTLRNLTPVVHILVYICFPKQFLDVNILDKFITQLHSDHGYSCLFISKTRLCHKTVHEGLDLFIFMLYYNLFTQNGSFIHRFFSFLFFDKIFTLNLKKNNHENTN